MANEITVNVSVGCNNGSFRQPTLGGQFQADQTTARGGSPGLVEVTNTGVDVNFGDVVPGWVFVKNLSDDTNLLIGPKRDDPAPSPSPAPSVAPDLDLQDFLELGPEQQIVLPLASGVTLRLASAGDPIDAQVVGLNV
jgi:hypothetical protein